MGSPPGHAGRCRGSKIFPGDGWISFTVIAPGVSGGWGAAGAGAGMTLYHSLPSRYLFGQPENERDDPKGAKISIVDEGVRRPAPPPSPPTTTTPSQPTYPSKPFNSFIPSPWGGCGSGGGDSQGKSHFSIITLKSRPGRFMLPNPPPPTHTLTPDQFGPVFPSPPPRRPVWPLGLALGPRRPIHGPGAPGPGQGGPGPWPGPGGGSGAGPRVPGGRGPRAGGPGRGRRYL